MEKELLHTKVVREIISLIASGEYPEDKRLPAERTLCDRFGISRGTLRKALADLVKIGAITIKPQSGAFVRRFSQKKIPKTVLPKKFSTVSLKDIIIARQAIELSSIELACDRIDTAELEAIDKMTADMEKQIDDLPAYLALDMAFHETIVKAGKNEVLVTAFEAISEYHKYSHVFSSTYEECEEDSLKFHKKILKALQNRDKKQAASCLSAHFKNMLEAI
jgi:GntR family transcriptional repressor for pyruvate dehydrogenase complex